MGEKGFKVSILASGSTGNSLYIETSKQKILVDAGLTGKKITQLLKEINRSPAELDKILVTHEHIDHIKGIGVLARKYNLDIYANNSTWQVIEPRLGKLDVAQKHLFNLGQVQTFMDLDVESFGVSHDAVSPQFYAFHKDGKSFVMLTDTGYVSEHLRGLIKGANAYLIESNHDVKMLRIGAYPFHLKQRILSDVGHLSNEDAAKVMVDVVSAKTQRVFLGHLSKANNLVDLAHLTMQNTLQEADVDVADNFKICDTSPTCATKLFWVK